MFFDKILIFIFSLVIFCANIGYAEVINTKLMAGDKAFEQQKYQDAYKYYEEILSNEQQYSEAMLLKMAFIKEKNNDIVTTLYYLQLYYAKTTDDKVLQKIIEMSENNKLKGHKPSDIQYLFFLFYQYISFIVSLVIVFIGSLAVWFFIRSRRGFDVLFPTILLGLFTLSFLYLYNFGKPKARAIVKTQKVIGMDLPSAGGTQTDLIDRGTCLQIVSKNDIWYKVLYDDKTVYVRENNLWLIP
jgi:hypothetical protein